MVQIVNLTPLNMIAGTPFWQGWELQDHEQTPVSLSGHEAACTFRRRNSVLHEVEMLVSGARLELSLSESEVSGLAGPEVSYEITIRNAGQSGQSGPIEVWRGSVNVQ